MFVSDLSLHDFRSWSELVVDLRPGVTAFLGPNGQGKTNIVEAVGYLGGLSSHRSAADTAMVRRGTGGAVVRAKIDDDGHTTLIEVEIVAGRANRAKINRGAVKPRAVIGLLPSVVFSPEDLDLVRGDPGIRRRYLDELATLLSPRLAAARTEYDKIARQRVALLKSAGAARRRGASPDLSTMAIWNEQLAAAGSQVIAARASLVRRLRDPVAKAYTDVSDNQGEARIDLRTSLTDAEETTLPDAAHLAGARGPDEIDPDTARAARETMAQVEEGLMDAAAVEARLMDAMRRVESRELDRGVNLVGPHRDDLSLALGPLPAKGFASHGESWSFALALRLGAWQVLREAGNTADPVLILDDVFAELDTTRRRRLAELVATADQVLVTAAVDDDVPVQLGARRLRVRDAAISSIDDDGVGTHEDEADEGQP